MNSKFLKLCERVKQTLNEQSLGSSIDDSAGQESTLPIGEPTSQPQSTEQPQMTSDEKSELPVATNKEIISAVKSLKNFYGKKKQLNATDIERIQMLSDDESDENVKNIIKTINNVFNPIDTIDTNPKNVPNSNYENNK
jgi:hypothetical protein